MKKLLYSVSTALLLLSCNTEDPSLEAEPGKGGNVITFVGRTFPETRTEIGVKDGNSYPVLWSSGDRIGIISPVETLFQNASATLNASDAGKNSGIFVLETETAVESSMDLIVYYPYSSYTTYGDGALHASVPMEQRQARPGDSSHTGKYTLAYDKTIFYKKQLEWRYLNGILRRWHENGWHTPEEVQQGDAGKPAQPSPKPDKPDQDNSRMEKYMKW